MKNRFENLSEESLIVLRTAARKSQRVAAKLSWGTFGVALANLSVVHNYEQEVALGTAAIFMASRLRRGFLENRVYSINTEIQRRTREDSETTDLESEANILSRSHSIAREISNSGFMSALIVVPLGLPFIVANVGLSSLAHLREMMLRRQLNQIGISLNNSHNQM